MWPLSASDLGDGGNNATQDSYAAETVVSSVLPGKSGQASKRSISAVQLAVQLGMTYKTAWYMLKHIRGAMK